MLYFYRQYEHYGLWETECDADDDYEIGVGFWRLEESTDPLSPVMEDIMEPDDDPNDMNWLQREESNETIATFQDLNDFKANIRSFVYSHPEKFI